MKKAPRPALPFASLQALRAPSRLLVDPEYLLEQLISAPAAQESAQAGPPPVGDMLTAMGGYGAARREMNFAHIRLSGLMRSDMATEITSALTNAFKDSEVDGVLFEVNTGGGEVTAASMIRNVIRERNKPVVTYAHLAASGGMLATMDSDEIVAAGRPARVGSIGVMMTLPKFIRSLYADFFEEVYSDTSEDKNKAFREWVKTGSTEEFQKDLTALDKIFMEEMSAARPLNKKLAGSTLAGGVWLAEEARQRGLVDSIGTMNYSLNRLASYAANKSNQ